MAWYNSSKDLGKALGGPSINSILTGDKNDAGILGVGQYKAKEIDINKEAFTDTAGYDQVNQELARAINGMKYSKGIDQAPQGEFRNYQMNLAKSLQEQANGGGPPSIAQQMLQNQTNQNIMAAQSQAGSMRGVNPAMALRLTQNQAANANQQAANQGAMLRSQEIQAAQNALGGITSNARGQDIDIAKAADQGKLARDQAVLQGIGAKGQIANQIASGKQDLERLRVQQQTGMNEINSRAYDNASDRRAKALGGLAEAAPAIIGMFSDKNLKTNIKDASSDPSVKEFLDALSSSTYEYKDKNMGEGKYMGPMAQDLEKTELGADMVIDTPDGKMVDYGRGAPAYLGIAGMLNDRLDGIEEQMKEFFTKQAGKKKG